MKFIFGILVLFAGLYLGCHGHPILCLVSYIIGIWFVFQK